MKFKIVTVVATAAVLVLSVAAIWYLTPKRYNATLDGVYYQLGEEGIIENVKLHLNGKLRNHINGKKSFKGVVDVKGEKVPQIPKDQAELMLHYTGENFGSIVSPFRVNDDSGSIAADMYFYGAAYINDAFSQFSIVLTNDKDKQWTPTDGYMITAPAQNREEAIQISQALMKKFGTVIGD
ncbi:hypothetical protein [Paenibacillus sp. NPDC058071]|uniref:hypothetical protein n=1 Tax=Paenibacillus sp. NPDC058071 TaxID=3346326 RepID=UPI0036D7E12E